MDTSKRPGRQVQQDSEWSFSCRSMPYGAYSDSDSDSDGESGVETKSSEARLLEDLDLSSREETVQYKPNPFSIAKINAASRPVARNALPTKPSLGDKSSMVSLHSHRPSLKTTSAVSKPNGSIIDGFKKQAQRPPKSKLKSPIIVKPSGPKVKPLPRASCVDNLSKAQAEKNAVPPRSFQNPLVAQSKPTDNVVPAQITPITSHTRSPLLACYSQAPDESLTGLSASCMRTLAPDSTHIPVLGPPAHQRLLHDNIASSICGPVPNTVHIPSFDSFERRDMAPVANTSYFGGPRTAYRTHLAPFSSPPRKYRRGFDTMSSPAQMSMSSPIKASPSMDHFTFDFSAQPRSVAIASIHPTGSHPRTSQPLARSVYQTPSRFTPPTQGSYSWLTGRSSILKYLFRT